MSASANGRAACLLAALIAFACRPEPPLPAGGEPLAAHAGELRAERETIELDLGEPAAREHLAAGFGADEAGPEGSVARASGPAAVVRLECWRPRDRVLRLRASGTGTARISLNRRAAGHLRLTGEPATHDVALERAFWRNGENLLQLEAEGALDLALDGLRFVDEEERAEGGPGAEFSDAGDLRLTAGAGAGFFLELPSGAWLTWSEVEAEGDGLRLEAAVRAEGGRAERPVSAFPGGGPGRLALTHGVPSLVHLSLRVVGDGAGELRIVEPSLRWPQARRPATPTGKRSAPAPRPTQPPGPPNLVVYLIDTLRADHLGCYGYPRPTSPAIDEFARTAVLFEEARAQSSWTRPALATILTGLHPVTHQAQNSNERVPEPLDTLAERLRSVGYQTAMVTTNGNVSGRFGFRQGFERFVYLPEDEASPELHVLSDVVQEHASRFLAERNRERPFFLLLHTTDPHDPYAPREPFRQRLAPGVPLAAGSAARLRELEGRADPLAPAEIAEMVALYDAEIAQNDAAFGALLALLESLGLDDSTALLLLSDHGEEFLEHGGWTHGKSLYEEQLRIPLLLRLPGGEAAGARPEGAAEQIDVAPTLLELAGVTVPSEMPGESLLPRIRGATASPRVSFAWLAREGNRLRSALHGPWKLIVQPAGPLARGPYARLFRLDGDPLELENLALDRPLRREWLAGILRAERLRRAPPLPVETVKVGPEMRKRLRALGYLR